MNIAIIGCGYMGATFAKVFRDNNVVHKDHLLLVERNEERYNELRHMNLGTMVSLDDDALLQCDLIMISVKPQDFGVLASLLQGRLQRNTVVLSIMAGIPTAHIKNALHHDMVIRTMPNAPVATGNGVTAFYSEAHVPATVVNQVEKLLSLTGLAIRIQTEGMLDAITALTGSGPAYVYYFIAAMVRAGCEMGMTESMAYSLVLQNISGALSVIQQSGTPVAALIRNVASKGGTTEAALKLLEDKEVAVNIMKAILAAEERARQLSR